VEPIAPLVGLRLDIDGDGRTVNDATLVADPPGVVTEMVPVVPEATIASIVVADTTLKEDASVPPNFTEVAPSKLVPVMVTVTPDAPLVGVNDAIVGAGMKVNPASTAFPPGVVTEIFPEEPVATTAVMVAASTTVNDAAAVPPKLTAVAPVKLVPLIVTFAPLAALVGVKEVIVGAGMKVNPASTALPPGVVTETSPEEPEATTAVMVVASTTVNDVAAVPPKLTAVASVKSVPLIVTLAPLAALVGVKEDIVGAGMNVNPARTPVPPGEVTETSPVAPVPTTAVMVKSSTTVNDAAGGPPKLTSVAPVKSVPLIVTVVPLAAVVGLNDVITGVCAQIVNGNKTKAIKNNLIFTFNLD
jgi:hypothetical protein